MLALALTCVLAAGPWPDAQGLEPAPGPIPPVPAKPNEIAWQPGELWVRPESHRHRYDTSGNPAGHITDIGALSGKTIYLSAGHGWVWTDTVTPNAWLSQRPNTNGIVEDLVSTETISQWLIPMLMNAGARVITVRESDLNTQLVIVDDSSAGYVETGSGFSNSSLAGFGPIPSTLTDGTNPFALGGNRLMPAATTNTAHVTYTANFPADGDYNVYVSYTAFTARVTDAHYLVHHAGGVTEFRVNQQHHGSTWVLLGRFHFQKGMQQALEVQNDSQSGLTNISLDAVRFGGGMGLYDRGGGRSGRPRFEECSRYATEFDGAPASVYDYLTSGDFNDDVDSRSRMAAYVHETGEDSLYLSWHTNATGLANSTATGTTIYVYGPNPPDGTYNFTGAAGSDTLATAVHDELINDFQKAAGWGDANWKDRGVDSAYFGELNPTHNNEMPSILMEMAFHDSVADATVIKQPKWRYIATRAISQAVIKWFATKDGVAVHLPPEPPASVSSVIDGSGAVQVKWHATTPDAQGVSGDAATGYRVYVSRDGVAWDDGVDTTGTSWTDPNMLAGGETRFYRVAATNAGGVSFPSETVGVSGAAQRVLLVNGFDRFDSTLGQLEDLSAYQDGDVLRIFVSRMNDGSYVASHGDAVSHAGWGFESATSGALAAGDVTVAGYPVVSWIGGRGHPASALTAPEETALTAAAHLFFSGSGLASSVSPAFLSGALQAGTSTMSTSRTVNGAGILAGVGPLTLDDGLGGSYDVGSPDLLTPGSSAESIASYSTGNGGGVAADHRVVSLGFGLETIESQADRREVMKRVLAYFDVAMPDAGVDSGTPDAGEPPDAGPSADGGAVDLPRVPNQFPAANVGCGCGSAGAPFVWLVLVLLARRRSAR